MEIFATFLLTIFMTQVSLHSWAVRCTRLKRLASFLGWGKKVEQLHVQPKPMQIRVGWLTVRTLTLHGHEPRNLEEKGQKVKRGSDTITAEQGTDPRGHGVCWRAAPGRPLSTAENGMPTRWKEIPLSLHVSWRLRAQQIHTDSLECQREKCSLHSQPFIEDKSPLSLHNQRLWKKELTKIKAWG